MRVAPAVVALVGPHNCGKTGLLRRLIDLASADGLRVGALKCAAQPLRFEPDGKDSARLAGGGAERVVTAGPGQTMVLESSPTRPTVHRLVRRFGRDLDLWLVESYTSESVPWVRVARAGQQPPDLDGDCIATVGVRGAPLPHFRLDRPRALWRHLAAQLELTCDAG